MWKCIFDETTKRGKAFNREPQAGEFAKDLHPSECAWFNSHSSRYKWDTGSNSLVEWTDWETEDLLEKKQTVLEKKLNTIDNIVKEKRSKNSTFLHIDGHNYYSDFEGIVGFYIALSFLPSNFTIKWKTADKEKDGLTNIEVTLDSSGLKSLAQSFFSSQSSIWFSGEAKKKEIKTIAKTESVESLEASDTTI